MTCFLIKWILLPRVSARNIRASSLRLSTPLPISSRPFPKIGSSLHIHPKRVPARWKGGRAPRIIIPGKLRRFLSLRIPIIRPTPSPPPLNYSKSAISYAGGSMESLRTCFRNFTSRMKSTLSFFWSGKDSKFTMKSISLSTKSRNRTQKHWKTSLQRLTSHSTVSCKDMKWRSKLWRNKIRG